MTIPSIGLKPNPILFNTGLELAMQRKTRVLGLRLGLGLGLGLGLRLDPITQNVTILSTALGVADVAAHPPPT